MENEWYKAYQLGAVTQQVTICISSTASQRTVGGKERIADRADVCIEISITLVQKHLFSSMHGGLPAPTLELPF